MAIRIEEHGAKPLLERAGIPVPRSRLATSPEEAAEAAAGLGAVMVKAQVPAGGRGKAGGVLAADGPEAARAAAARVLGMRIGAHRVERVLVEERIECRAELYCAVLDDPAGRAPLVLVAAAGGIDIETLAAARPDAVRRASVDIRTGFAAAQGEALLAGLELPCPSEALAGLLATLYRLYLECDAELLEINPLGVDAAGRLVALDCKLAIDESAAPRQAALAALATPEPESALERRAGELGLRYIELDGEVGVLANGAGLTMTTMDLVRHHGGRPANFLEIGGDAYTRGREALELVLANPRVRALVVNFCGAFARTDVMTEAIVAAWEGLEPRLPVHFSVHGTGAGEARALLGERLGIEPCAGIDEACARAVASAREGRS